MSNLFTLSFHSELPIIARAHGDVVFVPLACPLRSNVLVLVFDIFVSFFFFFQLKLFCSLAISTQKLISIVNQFIPKLNQSDSAIVEIELIKWIAVRRTSLTQLQYSN